MTLNFKRFASKCALYPHGLPSHPGTLAHYACPFATHSGAYILPLTRGNKRENETHKDVRVRETMYSHTESAPVCVGDPRLLMS